MGDLDLRALERRLVQGDPDARRLLLVARVRAGQLSEERLRLAAYAGDPDALLIVGAALPPKRTKAWLLGLATFGKPVAVRAALLAARLAVPTWRHLGSVRSIAAVEVADSWLAAPSEELRVKAGEAARACSRERRGRSAWNCAMAASRADRTPFECERAAALAARDTAAAAWNVRALYRSPLGYSALAAAVFGVRDMGRDRALTVRDVHEAIERQLRNWALGDEALYLEGDEEAVSVEGDDAEQEKPP